MGDAPRVAGPSDAERVAEIIANAFHDDPVWSWVFPDPRSRSLQLVRWWRFFIDAALPRGWVWLTAHGEEAAAVWIPPGAPELPPELEPLMAPLLRDLVGAHADLAIEGVERFDAAHPVGPPHFYLSLVGTHDDHRGKGIGVGLLADNLARIDALQSPAYLESSNPANLARYERLGFVATGAFDLPRGGPRVTTMWREPVPPLSR